MELREQIEGALAKVRPGLQADGGDIELVEVHPEEKAISVRLKGACFGCPMSTITIKGYVEGTIRAEVPGIEEVRLVR